MYSDSMEIDNSVKMKFYCPFLCLLEYLIQYMYYVVSIITWYTRS